MSVILEREAPVLVPEQAPVVEPPVEEPVELRVLRKARELLSDRSRWCRRQFAMNKWGNACFSDDPSARQWCAIGAIRWAATAEEHPGVAAENVVVLCQKTGNGSVIGTNDGPDGYERIMECFDKTISTFHEGRSR